MVKALLAGTDFWLPLGNAIRNARVARKLTVREFAKQAGYAKSMISQVENGKKRMPADRCFAICEQLGINIYKVLERGMPKTCPKCGGKGIV